MATERKIVRLGYQAKRAKYSYNTNLRKWTRDPGETTVRGTVELFYPKQLTEYLDIPSRNFEDGQGLVDAAEFAKLVVKVRQHDRALFDGVTDTTAKNIVMDEFYRIGGGESNKKAKTKSIRVPLIGKTTSKGTQRYVSLAFPYFFNLIMITQAVGSMIRTTSSAKKPLFFIAPSGRRHPMVYNTSTNVFAGLDVGAWCLETSAPDVAEQNVDNKDDIPKKSKVKGGGSNRKKASA